MPLTVALNYKSIGSLQRKEEFKQQLFNDPVIVSVPKWANTLAEKRQMYRNLHIENTECCLGFLGYPSFNPLFSCDFSFLPVQKTISLLRLLSFNECVIAFNSGLDKLTEEQIQKVCCLESASRTLAFYGCSSHNP